MQAGRAAGQAGAAGATCRTYSWNVSGQSCGKFSGKRWAPTPTPLKGGAGCPLGPPCPISPLCISGLLPMYIVGSPGSSPILGCMTPRAGGAATPQNAPGAGSPPAGSCPAAGPDASRCACLRPAESKASCAQPERDESPGELLAYVSSEEPEGQSSPWLPLALPWPKERANCIPALVVSRNACVGVQAVSAALGPQQARARRYGSGARAHRPK